MTSKQNVGSLIKAKRKETGMTTREFAKGYGLSAAVLSQLENDNIKTPTMKTISAIARALDLPVLTVCDMYNYCDENDAKEDNKLTPEQALIKALGDYGVPQEAIGSTMSYINYVTFSTVFAERTEPRRKDGSYYAPSQWESIKQVLFQLNIDIPTLYKRYMMAFKELDPASKAAKREE